ncbi:MAG: hypothetical protein ACK4SY_10115 [Pyrobaculum sp.]
MELQKHPIKPDVIKPDVIIKSEPQTVVKPETVGLPEAPQAVADPIATTAGEIWAKVGRRVKRILRNELRPAVEELCIHGCGPGLKVYGPGEEPEPGMEPLFVVRPIRYSRQADRYHIDGPKFVESTLRSIAASRPGTRLEALLEKMRQLVHEDPRRASKYLAYMAFASDRARQVLSLKHPEAVRQAEAYLREFVEGRRYGGRVTARGTYERPLY